MFLFSEGQLPRGASYIEETQTKSQQNHQRQSSKDERHALIGQHEIRKLYYFIPYLIFIL